MSTNQRLRHSASYRRANPMERFCLCVETRPDGCWFWLGAPNAAGYGTLKVDGQTVAAHRFAYEWLIGPIPDGLQLDHLCRVRRCVNPTHLEPVTSRDNSLRGDTLAARQSAQTHCIHGHALSGDNLRFNGGKRVCRTCNAQRARKWRSDTGRPKDSRGRPRAWTFGLNEREYKPVVET